jgi:group II intron reverse transcriptase/maturase
MTEEGRGGHMNRLGRQNINHTGGGNKMASAYDKIAQQAARHGKVQTIMHYVNKANLAEEHKQQEKGKATGIDRVTKEEYGKELEKNLADLLERMKRYSYRPQPVRRTYIPKTGSDKMRPLGIPAYEDKLVQGSMRRVLDEVYKEKFYDFSYGFREGKGCHQAISEVNRIIGTQKISFVVDADIKGFFDNVDHKWLMKFLEHDIEDKNFLRYVKRFLKAGIMEGLARHESDKGTPQGGLISPVLANIYLHYVLDMWFEKAVKGKYNGEAHIVRYADDFVCMFQYENEANKFYRELKERLKKFGLELAEDKSRVIPFGRFARENSRDGKTETFDFLGFTHINGKTRSGKYRVVHRTSKTKLKAKKQAVKEWLKYNIHRKPSDTIILLNRKLIGHYRYYGISGNSKGLNTFYQYIIYTLYKALTRRSQRTYLTWARFYSLLKKHPIATPKIYVDIWQTV